MSDPAERVLGVDLGDARIGLAISDPLGVTAQPLGNLPGSGRARAIAAVLDAAREHHAVVIVVGYPKLMSGDVGERARSAEIFADGLRKSFEGSVVLWDERLTSVAAQRALIEGGVRRRRRREAVDAVAAALILQGWLDAQRSSST